MNPWTLGALLGIFVMYPYMVWRNGHRELAAYWLDPVSFNGPVEHFISLHMKRPLPKSTGQLILGHMVGIFHASIFGFIVFGFLLTPIYLAFGWNG